jgi:hypothetical protein
MTEQLAEWRVLSECWCNRSGDEGKARAQRSLISSPPSDAVRPQFNAEFYPAAFEGWRRLPVAESTSHLLAGPSAATQSPYWLAYRSRPRLRSRYLAFA